MNAWASRRRSLRLPIRDDAHRVAPFRRKCPHGSLGRLVMVKRLMLAAAIAAAPMAAAVIPEASAFCGFYVGKPDTSLFNEASQVILAREGRRTTLSMMNDYKGELTDFALVVPVPVVLKREQVKVIEKKTFDRLDAYSAPRLAEYFDGDPCVPPPP